MGRAGGNDGFDASEGAQCFCERAAAGHASIRRGGGITPMVGLRFGAGFAQGAYRSSPSIENSSADASDVTIFNAETEYAFGHTRLSGEWVRNRFESTMGPAVARGYFAQAVHAFTPRILGIVRVVGASSPAYTGAIRQRRNMTTTELTGGYRLTHDLTLRAGYYASRRYGATQRDHSAVASLVWARRWF
jgi:hypothetical protein